MENNFILAINNIFCLAGLEDKPHFRNYNTHNNLPVLALELDDNFRIRKKIDMHQSAWFLPFCVHSSGK